LLHFLQQRYQGIALGVFVSGKNGIDIDGNHGRPSVREWIQSQYFVSPEPTASAGRILAIFRRNGDFG
jgi:hypothetical protein